MNTEVRRFSEPGAGIPHAGIFGGASGQLLVLRYLGNGGAEKNLTAARHVRRERKEKTRAMGKKIKKETFDQKTLD